MGGFDSFYFVHDAIVTDLLGLIDVISLRSLIIREEVGKLSPADKLDLRQNSLANRDRVKRISQPLYVLKSEVSRLSILTPILFFYFPSPFLGDFQCEFDPLWIESSSRINSIPFDLFGPS